MNTTDRQYRCGGSVFFFGCFGIAAAHIGFRSGHIIAEVVLVLSPPTTTI